MAGSGFFPGQKKTQLFFKKDSRPKTAVFFLLIFAFLFSGCESPGVVGDDIISNDDLIESTVNLVENLSVITESTFSGRLANTSVGFVDDPLYGTLRSVALLKPAISSSDVDTLYTGDKIFLRLMFNEEIYGEPNAISDFEIYEAGEIWRGNQLRYNQQEISVDHSSKVADFQVAENDTIVWVELSQNWTNKFTDYFNNTAADRDSLYRNTFPGLAIVPSENNRQMRFLKNLPADDIVTSFYVESEFHDDEDENNGNGEEDENGEDDENGDEEDHGMQNLGIRDWGASFTRTVSDEITDAVVLHNTESLLKVELDLPTEDLKSKNITNAQLVLSLNLAAAEQHSYFERPQTNLLTTYVFNEKPHDLAAEIFITEPTDVRDFTLIEDDDDTFNINITQYVLNEVFGEADERELYIAIQTTNGILYSSQFFDLNGPDNKKPRIVITSVK